MNEPFRMLDPDLQGIDAPPPPRIRARCRASATRHLTVHWLDKHGCVSRTTQETLPAPILIGVEGIKDAAEVWWHMDGRVSTAPAQRRGNK
jgi:hypothetical protein